MPALISLVSSLYFNYLGIRESDTVLGIYASYFYPKSQGPRYWQANVANVAFSGACIILATVLRFYLRWRNNKLDRASEEDLREEGTTMGTRCRALGEKWQCHPDYRYTT